MKKWYFVVSGALQIILAILVFAFSSTIIEQSLGQFDSIEEALYSELGSEELAEAYMEDMPSVYGEDFNLEYLKDMYSRIIDVCCLVNIIFGIVLINYALTDQLIKHKITVAVMSVTSLLSSLHLIIMLLQIANLIIIFVVKPTEKDQQPDEKKKVIPLELAKVTSNSIAVGLVMILAYVCLYAMVAPIIPKILPGMNSTLEFVVCEVLIPLLVLIIIMYLNQDEFKKGWQALKENPKGYKYFIIIATVISMIITAIGNIMSFSITGDVSANQKDLAEVSFWYLVPLAVFWAPIVEESVFRGALRKMISNKWGFIIASGLLFGLVHALGENTIRNMIIVTIPYSLMGGAFAYIYTKTNNIWVNILMHALNNVLAMIALYIAAGM